MYKFLFRLAWIGGLAFGMMVIGLYFFAETLLGLLYGEEYRPYAFFAVLQGIFFMHNHFYRLEFFACRATNRTSDIAKASLIMAIGSIIFGVMMIHVLGGNAIILALIFGQILSHIFLIYMRKNIRG
jgi:O-antigen/teichoic acid export membrane protein